MIRKLRRDALKAEVENLAHLVAVSTTNSPLAAISMRNRLKEVEAELREVEAEREEHGAVALFFSGGRVEGSRAIDAEFAATSLKAYQDLVIRTVIQRRRGPIGARGPVPDKDIPRLNITGTLPGSFGFTLEEAGADQQPMFATAVKEAIESVTAVMQGFASSAEQDYASALEDLDPRTLVSLKELLQSLREADATIRIVEGEHDVPLDRGAIELAYTRADQSKVEEHEESAEGTLIGFLPTRRSFEFIRGADNTLVTGRVGSQLSNELTKRMTDEGMSLGKRWKAHFVVRETARSGVPLRTTYTLVGVSDLDDDGGAEPVA